MFAHDAAACLLVPGSMSRSATPLHAAHCSYTGQGERTSLPLAQLFTSCVGGGCGMGAGTRDSDPLSKTYGKVEGALHFGATKISKTNVSRSDCVLFLLVICVGRVLCITHTHTCIYA